MKGAVSAQKALQVSETETRELLGGTEEKSISRMRGPGSMILYKKETEIKIVSGQTFYLPALFVDLGLKVAGQKPFLMKIVNRMSMNMKALVFFANREWTWSNQVGSLTSLTILGWYPVSGGGGGWGGPGPFQFSEHKNNINVCVSC